MSALSIGGIIFLFSIIVTLFLLIINKTKGIIAWTVPILSCFLLSGAIYYVKDISHTLDDEITEEEYKKNIFFWKMNQEKNKELLLEYGILKKESIFSKSKNIMYVRVPSLKKLNENQLLKDEFNSYKQEFNHKRLYLQNMLKPNMVIYEKRYSYVLFEDNPTQLYPIDLITETIQKKYKLIISEDDTDIILDNINYKKVNDIYFYNDMKEEFITNGFTFIENENSKDNIILELDYPLSDEDYHKILKIYEKYKEYKLNLIIVNDGEKEIYNYNEIINEINNL